MKSTLKSLFILLLAAFTFGCTPEAVHVERVTLDTTSITLFEQETYQLKAVVSPSNAANQLVLWTSDNSSVATVTQDGLVTAVSSGIATITVSSDEFGRTAECSVNVVPRNASSITLDVSELTLHELEQYIFKPSLEPKSADTKTLVWSSSDPEVATVSAGVVHAIKAGQAVITAASEDGKAKAECALTVVCDVKGVKFEDHSYTMKIGTTLQLAEHVHVYPDRASNKELAWESSDSKVATVSDGGEVKAVTSGTAQITVTTKDGSHTDVCTIEVDIAELKLNATSLNMVVEDVFDLIASEPSGAVVSDVSWSSTDPSVASVDDKGHVVAESAGDAVICATTLKGGHHAFCTVNVRNKVESITMNKHSADIFIGETLSLSVTLDPKEAEEYVKIVWKSSNEQVATVDQNGKVTPVGKGTAVITASTTDGKVHDECSVKVTQPVTSISVSPKSLLLWTDGESGKVTVSIGPDDADDKSYNVDYATNAVRDVVSFTRSAQTITVKPLKVGKTKLEVAPQARLDFNVYTSFEVEVRAHVASVSIKGEESRLMNVGATLQLETDVHPSDAYDKTVTWASDNTEVATVDSKGKVTAKAPGSAVITVTTKDGEKTASCTVTVAQPVSSVSVTPTTLTLTEGDTGELTATVEPKEADQAITWASNKTSVATVAEDGTVTAVSAGEAVIIATSVADPSKTASCKVTVNAKIIHVSSVILNPETLEMYVGDTKELGYGVTVLPRNTSVGVKRTLTWKSSDRSVATVGDSGLVTAVGVGTTTITCTSDDNSEAFDECVVTVSLPPVAVESITLSKTSATMAYSSYLRLVATVLPEDATNKELTWSSSNTSVATVDNTGMVTAKSKTGTAVITVKSVDNESIQAQCSISVIPQVVPPSGISINPRSLSLYVGQTKKITATVSPSNVTDKTVVWTAAGGTYVMVDQQGNVTGMKPGNTNVTAATAGGEYTTTARITVSVNAVTSIDISHPNGITLRVGEEFDLTATPIAEDRTADPSYPAISWNSNSSSVATVDQTGHIKALKAGTATITVVSVNNTSVKATCRVTVVDSTAGDNGHEGVGFEDWNF